VWDNGLGISVENQKKLFKLFGTIENDKNLNKKGIGLGLYICKKICKQFGGDIEVVSDLGLGSMFTYKMRLYDEENENLDESAL
jgi:signal transduction histidine kinase